MGLVFHRADDLNLYAHLSDLVQERLSRDTVPWEEKMEEAGVVVSEPFTTGNQEAGLKKDTSKVTELEIFELHLTNRGFFF